MRKPLFILYVVLFFYKPLQAQSESEAKRVIAVKGFEDVVADDAVCSFREAFMLSQKSDVTDEEKRFQGCILPSGTGVVSIQLETGVYTLSIPNSGGLITTDSEGRRYTYTEHNPAEGDLDISPHFEGYTCRSVTVSGRGWDKTIVDGNTSNRIFDAIRVLNNESPPPACNVTLTVEDLTLQNGRATEMAASGSFPHSSGSGGAINFYLPDINSPDSSLVLRNMVLKNNHSSHIIAYEERCKIQPETASRESWNYPSAGGAFLFYANHLSIENVVFDHNASGLSDCVPSEPIPFISWGGAGVVFMQTYGSQSLNIENSIFTHNTSGSRENSGVQVKGMGGALFIVLTESASNATRMPYMARNHFAHNTAHTTTDAPACSGSSYGGAGGAVSFGSFSSNISSIWVEKNYFESNAGSSGSAIALYNNVNMLGMNNTFAFNQVSNTEHATVQNCPNTGASKATLLFSTFIENTGGYALLLTPDSTLKYSYLYKNNSENTLLCHPSMSTNDNIAFNVFNNGSCRPENNNFPQNTWEHSSTLSFNDIIPSFSVTRKQDSSLFWENASYYPLKLENGRIVTSSTSETITSDQFPRSSPVLRTTPGAIETNIPYQTPFVWQALSFVTRKPSEACPNNIVVKVQQHIDTNKNNILDANEFYSPSYMQKDVCLDSNYSLYVEKTPANSACSTGVAGSHSCEKSTHTVRVINNNPDVTPLFNTLCVCEGEEVPTNSQEQTPPPPKRIKHGCGCNNSYADPLLLGVLWVYTRKKRKINTLFT